MQDNTGNNTEQNRICRIYDAGEVDVCVIGAGHAGIEVCARRRADGTFHSPVHNQS